MSEAAQNGPATQMVAWNLGVKGPNIAQSTQIGLGQCTICISYSIWSETWLKSRGNNRWHKPYVQGCVLSQCNWELRFINYVFMYHFNGVGQVLVWHVCLICWMQDPWVGQDPLNTLESEMYRMLQQYEIFKRNIPCSLVCGTLFYEFARLGPQPASSCPLLKP
jgi:hypothetical protein